jgi:hypothetical protein
MTIKLGQRVKVSREGVCPHDTLPLGELYGMVVSVTPPPGRALDHSLLIAFELTVYVAWVHERYLLGARPDHDW